MINDFIESISFQPGELHLKPGGVYATLGFIGFGKNYHLFKYHKTGICFELLVIFSDSCEFC